ncbi:MAG: damage-control phosphatase ARMT1 family protein [bacterium]
MILDSACIPCIINQAYNVSRLTAKNNKVLQVKIMKKVCSALTHIDENAPAPLFTLTMQRIVENAIGKRNIYKDIKKKNIAKVKGMVSYFDELMKNASDRLEMAIRIAIAGNTIDVAANPHFDAMREISQITHNSIDRKAYKHFQNDIKKASVILYIGDNYEEALFDKVLLTILNTRRLVFAVRSYPILNDVTLEDARRLKINKVCEVIESGSKIAGTDLDQCTDEFRELFKTADVVIAKGQGNYETLMDVDRPIYFLFKVKCEAIARRSGLPIGTSALYLNQR